MIALWHSSWLEHLRLNNEFIPRLHIDGVELFAVNLEFLRSISNTILHTFIMVKEAHFAWWQPKLLTENNVYYRIIPHHKILQLQWQE